MKKFAWFVALLGLFGGGVYIFRAQVGAALQQSDVRPFQNLGWAFLEAAHASPAVSEHVGEQVLELRNRWVENGGELIGQDRWDARQFLDLINYYDLQIDEEIYEPIIHLCIAVRNCVDYEGLKSPGYGFDHRVGDFERSPRAVAAVHSYARLPVFAGKSDDFFKAVKFLADRNALDESLIRRSAVVVLTDEVSVGAQNQLEELRLRSPDSAAWRAAWIFALDEAARDGSYADSTGGLDLALEDLRVSRELLTLEANSSILAACSNYSVEGLIPACVDFAISRPNFMNYLDYVGSGAGEGDQTTANQLFEEVIRLLNQTPETFVAELIAKSTPPGDPINQRRRQDGYMFASYGRYLDQNKRFARRTEREIQLLRSAAPNDLELLYQGYQSDNRKLVWLTAQVLAEKDREQFARVLMSQIEGFREPAAEFTYSYSYDHPEFFYGAVRVGEGLTALEPYISQESSVYPWILALSIPEAGFSRWSTEFLTKNLSGTAFSNALFRYLAVRESFLVSEVDVYENALVSYPAVSASIVRNMDLMLREANGQPERAPWIRKLIGLRALARVGTSESIPIVQRYAEDSSIYVSVERSDSDPSDSRSEERRFSDLAKSALQQIRGRL